MKIKLVLQPNQFTSFTSFYLESLWQQYFDIEIYNADKTYNKQSTLFVLYSLDFKNLATQLIDKGYKVVVDHLWEFDDKQISTDQILFLRAEKWFWYNESLWWRSLNYHEYQPRKQVSKLALMQIRRQDSSRDYLVQQLESKLSQFLYSYKTVTLPVDLSSDDPLYQRYFNPDWYDQTWMTLIVESSTAVRSRPFITEKTCKPLAYQHPFMIVGNPGSLTCLKNWGFVTYDNLFNESYDSMDIYPDRLSEIINNLNNVVPGKYDKETLNRLKHNHNHYFNLNLIQKGIVDDIVTPILEFMA